MNANHVGREVTVSALGQDWTFSRWDRRTWEAIAAWAKPLLPNPLREFRAVVAEFAAEDAQILRDLYIADLAEEKKAAEEKRLPVLMAPKYTPFADMMAQKAIDKAACHLEFFGAPMQSVLSSPGGAVQVVYLLLKAKHPDITEDTAEDIATELGKRLKDIFAICRGEMPPAPKNDEAPAASKS